MLRLLRGEPLDAVSRERPVPAREFESWKRVLLETSGRGLKGRSDPGERELSLARVKGGELTMRLELAEYLIEKGLWGRMAGEGHAQRGLGTAVPADADLRGFPGGSWGR